MSLLDQRKIVVHASTYDNRETSFSLLRLLPSGHAVEVRFERDEFHGDGSTIILKSAFYPQHMKIFDGGPGYRKFHVAGLSKDRAWVVVEGEFKDLVRESKNNTKQINPLVKEILDKYRGGKKSTLIQSDNWLDNQIERIYKEGSEGKGQEQK